MHIRIESDEGTEWSLEHSTPEERFRVCELLKAKLRAVGNRGHRVELATDRKTAIHEHLKKSGGKPTRVYVTERDDGSGVLRVFFTDTPQGIGVEYETIQALRRALSRWRNLAEVPVVINGKANGRPAYWRFVWMEGRGEPCDGVVESLDDVTVYLQDKHMTNLCEKGE